MEEREIHLRDYLRVIVKRRYAIASFCAVFTLVIAIYSFVSEPVYYSFTRVLVEPAEPSNFMSDYAKTKFDPQFYDTQFELIRSSSVSQKAVEGIWDDPEFRKYADGLLSRGSLLSWVSGLFSGGEGSTSSMGQERVAARIARDISVDSVGNSKIIEIGFNAGLPDVARKIASAITNAYVDAMLEIKVSSSKRTLDWLARKVHEERKKLDDSEHTLQTYMKDNNIITVEDRLTILPQKLAELSTRVTAAEGRRKELEALYKKVSNFSGDLRQAESIDAISSDAMVQSLMQKVLLGEQRILELSKKYKEKHPEMINARTDLEALRRKKDAETLRVISSIRNEYDLALSNEQSLREAFVATKQEAMDVNEKFIKYGILKREVDTNRQIYDSLIKRMKEQSITEEIRDINIWVVEEARRPGSPIRPKKFTNILAGLIMGLLGGMGLAFLIEHMDNTVKSSEEVEEKLGVPVLASVPSFKTENDGGGLDQIVLRDPRSTFAECYKVLRTSIMLSSADSPPKNMLVTSMGPSEGKTVTSVNLALALAQSELRVLLVDADMRKPRVHKVFGLDNDMGLSNYLTGTDADIFRKGPIGNLDIVTSGPIPPNPSELMGSNRFADFMRTVSGNYDMVLFDSPPLLTVTDSLILSKRLDGTVLVIRAGVTTYDAVAKGIRMLQDMKAHVLGMMLNAQDVSKGGYYNYYKYYSAYYQYKDE